MIATFKNRQPAKVAPIAFNKGLFLKFLDLIGSVPNIVTIIKKITITTIFNIANT